ncbi:unnamed protein product, partial [Laminaria digitata]
ATRCGNSSPVFSHRPAQRLHPDLQNVPEAVQSTRKNSVPMPTTTTSRSAVVNLLRDPPHPARYTVWQSFPRFLTDMSSSSRVPTRGTCSKRRNQRSKPPYPCQQLRK